jgi:hypothetical protein
MVTFALAVDGSWAQIYHQWVQASLEEATVAASTNSDHNPLIVGENPASQHRAQESLAVRKLNQDWIILQ